MAGLRRLAGRRRRVIRMDTIWYLFLDSARSVPQRRVRWCEGGGTSPSHVADPQFPREARQVGPLQTQRLGRARLIAVGASQRRSQQISLEAQDGFAVGALGGPVGVLVRRGHGDGKVPGLDANRKVASCVAIALE